MRELDKFAGMHPDVWVALGLQASKTRIPPFLTRMCSPKHGLVFELYPNSYYSFYRVYLSFKDGREDLLIYRSADGGFVVTGPQWDYIEHVFTPWILKKLLDFEEKNAKTQAEKKAVAQARLEQNVSDWARGKKIPQIKEDPPDDRSPYWFTRGL
jgi:hypothetical protein